jgi:glycylpeptide N-tetradecanoyltransferase
MSPANSHKYNLLCGYIEMNTITMYHFYSKILDIRYLDEIHFLLNNNYVENSTGICRMLYSRDYLYWYLNYIPKGFIIGLITSTKKLIGVITATPMEIIIHEDKKIIPFISFLCIHKKFRGNNLHKMLIASLQDEIIKNNFDNAIFFSENDLKDTFVGCGALKSYAIPINHKKLFEVGFLNDDKSILPLIESDNPLHLLCETYLEQVTMKLNSYMKKFNVKIFFTLDSARHFLLPKKNIVYSFIYKNENGDITDFISFYKNYYYCIEQQKMLSIAVISYYFYESMTLTELITYVIDKLVNYGIDQLNFYNNLDNMNVDIVKYLTDTNLELYMIGNTGLEGLHGNEIGIYPF